MRFSSWVLLASFATVAALATPVMTESIPLDRAIATAHDALVSHGGIELDGRPVTSWDWFADPVTSAVAGK